MLKQDLITKNNSVKYRYLKITLLILIIIFVDLLLTECINLIAKLDIGYYGLNIFSQLFMLISGIAVFYIFTKKNPVTLFMKSDIHKMKNRRMVWILALVPVVIILSFLYLYIYDANSWFHLISSDSQTLSQLIKDIFVFSFLTGFSEEMLYRGALIGTFVFLLSDPNKKINFFFVSIMSAIIFAFAHLGWNFNPFEVYYDSYQLLTALLLGFVEAALFYKTRNLIYPILLHASWNLFSIVITYLIIILF